MITKFVNEIESLHGEIESALKVCLDKAIRIGLLLTEAKESLQHGEFGAWVDENLSFSMRTAQRYMKVYQRRNELEGCDTVTDAYRMIEAPKNDTVSHLDIPDSIMKLGAILETIEDDNEIWGFRFESVNDLEVPAFMVIRKRENEKVDYGYYYFDVTDNCYGFDTIKPIEIAMFLHYLCLNVRFSCSNTIWLDRKLDQFVV